MLREEFAELIIHYLYNPAVLDKYSNYDITFINPLYAEVHIPISQFNMRTVSTFGYSSLPKLYGLTSEASLEASGVNDIRNIPILNFRGSGVLVCIIDTGIDYTNPVFIKEDGTTKIAALWDQTIDTDIHPIHSTFGAEYRATQINQALASPNPLEIVPSFDENGHGTMMAAIASGNEVPEENFSGVAPDSELIIVKLRQATSFLREFYVVPEDVLCYQENDIMWAVHYCLVTARELLRPVVICLGLGTSQGSHNGRNPLDRVLNFVADYPGVAIVTSVGNEGNKGRHFMGSIIPDLGYHVVELNVGEGENGFSMELWGDSPGIYSIDILSPSGEFVTRIPPGLRVNREITFTFEETVINIDYLLAESSTGDQLILMRFRNITPGIWYFNVYGQGDLPLSFHIWLPMGDMITDNTYFIQPTINMTVLSPSTADLPIAMTAYNPTSRNLYVNASRGYSRSGNITPELAAPGVNYLAPNNRQEFVTYNGTSCAAAHTAGIAAIILEWSSVRGNLPGMDTLEIKNYLIRGAVRNPLITYPNRDWGYGILNVYNSFNTLRIDFGI